MQSKVIWLFGLSGAGKSTIAQQLVKHLKSNHYPIVLLDGDEVRSSVNKDLGFSDEDRMENIRRSAEFAKLLIGQNMFVIAAFITPRKIMRDLVKQVLNDKVILFFIDTPLEECIKRDVKSLYKKATGNEIKDFTGIQSVFEIPENENVITISTINKSPEECANEILNYLTLK
ncbi:MAG: adenylyl-sulfate kinase [Bacteroidota bacterium]